MPCPGCSHCTRDSGISPKGRRMSSVHSCIHHQETMNTGSDRILSEPERISFIDCITCSVLDLTCSILDLTCSVLDLTCSILDLTCSVLDLTCSLLDLTCSLLDLTSSPLDLSAQ